MKKVRFLDEPKEEKALKPIEITHALNINKGWKIENLDLEEGDELIYLGKCNVDGDMFLCKSKRNVLSVWKGNLNDGIY